MDLDNPFRQGAGRLWLFLDYDGTLADFAPNPDVLLPDTELINLMRRLAAYPERLRVVILSGRRVSHIQSLLPVPGILVAGTYGVELVTWAGEPVSLLNINTGRPILDEVKVQWLELVGERPGFYVEDKGYAVALHARQAAEPDASQTLAAAEAAARGLLEGILLDRQEGFRLASGFKFLEVAPLIADKGQSVNTLLERFPWPGAQIMYFGDDDKDEPAFRVVRQQGGTAVLVAEQERPTQANRRIANPSAVRAWLARLAQDLEAQAGGSASGEAAA